LITTFIKLGRKKEIEKERKKKAKKKFKYIKGFGNFRKYIYIKIIHVNIGCPTPVVPHKTIDAHFSDFRSKLAKIAKLVNRQNIIIKLTKLKVLARTNISTIDLGHLATGLYMYELHVITGLSSCF